MAFDPRPFLREIARGKHASRDLTREQAPQRVGTFEILELLGHAPVATIDEAEERLDSRLVAAVPVGVLSPDLARLLDARLAVGVRNSSHTMAKLMLPRGVEARTASRL